VFCGPHRDLQASWAIAGADARAGSQLWIAAGLSGKDLHQRIKVRSLEMLPCCEPYNGRGIKQISPNEEFPHDCYNLVGAFSATRSEKTWLAVKIRSARTGNDENAGTRYIAET